MKKCFACLLCSACLLGANAHGLDVADRTSKVIEDVASYEGSSKNDSAFYFGLGIGYDHVNDKLNLEHVSQLDLATGDFDDYYSSARISNLSSGRAIGAVGLGLRLACPGDFFAALEFWANLGKNSSKDFANTIEVAGTDYDFKGKLKRKGFEPYFGILMGYFFKQFGTALYATFGGTFIKFEYDTGFLVGGLPDVIAHRSCTSMTPTLGLGVAKRICNFDVRLEGKVLLNATKSSEFGRDIPAPVGLRITHHAKTSLRSWKLCAYVVRNINFWD